MPDKLKNILIFGAIGISLFAIYFFFFKPSGDNGSALVSSTPSTTTATGTPTGAPLPEEAQGLVDLLLSVNSITLNDSLFSDPAFLSLHDSSITLVPEGNEGRPNPFAPFGSDVLPAGSSSSSTSSSSSSSSSSSTGTSATQQ